MKEEEIVKLLQSQNDEFRRLGEEHRELDEKLSELNGRVYLTPEEELEKKSMQKMKLMKKDKMAEMVRQYRDSITLN